MRPLVLRAVGLGAVGVATGLLWTACAGPVRAASDGIERELGGEVAFAVIAVLVGTAVGVFGFVRPGAQPVPAAAVLLFGSGAASLVAWGVGRLLGAPVIHATGVLVLLPLAASLMTAAASLAAVLVHPGEPAS